MKETGILYTSPMVRAILAGIKTMTRRELGKRAARLDPAWPLAVGPTDKKLLALCPYGQPGDLLWVKETFYAWGYWEVRHNAKKGRDEWHFVDITLETGRAYRYAADEDGTATAPARMRRTAGGVPRWWKRPAIFMPRVASRILLEITSVRVERLQDISEADAIAEGIETPPPADPVDMPVWRYRKLWEQINGPASWATNPWVWVVEFKVLKGGSQ